MIRYILSVVALSLATVAAPAAANPLATSARPAAVAADTLLRLNPPRRVLIAPELLARARELVRAHAEAEPVVRLYLPSDEARATVYARYYRISPDLALQIVESAIAEGVDPDLAFRLVRVESVFQVRARGRSGALGLTQLMPSTARAVDPSLRTEEQIFEPANNLRVGFRYLRMMMDRYDGDVRLALLAYNRGETAVDRSIRAGRDPGNGYASKVLNVSGTTYRGRGFSGGE
jgi:soluble lytic murein transglycosylase-like protein